MIRILLLLNQATMATKTLSNTILVGVVFAALAIGVSVQAQTTTTEPTFPITELGGCADRTACKAYCDIEANYSACSSYAQSRGLKRLEQAQQNNTDRSKLLEKIKTDGGPGKCGANASDPVQACKAYCDDTTHIQACVAYGKTHSLFKGEALQKAEKISAALKSGVTLPSGCTDAESCKEACEKPSTVDQAKSCYEFAKAAGVLPKGFNEDGAKKVFSAIASSSAPFKSIKDFARCNGATNPEIIKKCTEFAAQSGLITQEQAQKLQQTGGTGPGGCTGKEACATYCKTHQDECREFAKENNLAPEGTRMMGTSTQNSIPRPMIREGKPMQNISSTTAPRPDNKRPPSMEGRQSATTTSFLGFVGQTAAAFLSGIFR